VRFAWLGILALSGSAIAARVEAAEPPEVAKVWPQEQPAPPGAPNVLVWMLDDAGFAQLGAYGGIIDTPNIDALAERGLRYTAFHTTAVCSATRASFMTGRFHHAISMGSHAAAAAPYPGYVSRIPRSAASLARVLQLHGYRTFALGKWDHLPTDHVSPSGPFDYWPSGQGFDRFYGFLGADTSNFRPAMWLDHEPVDPGRDRDDYHLTTDLADRAIEWIEKLHASSPERPFFLYFATGAVHAPHHAPREYIERYRGRFAMGWDEARRVILRRQKQLGIVGPEVELPERPALVPAWEELGPDAKRLFAHAMEVFAAQLTHADHEFGRILAALERSRQLENTLVLVTSDNGASAEGGPNGSYSEFRFGNGLETPLETNLAFESRWGSSGTYNHYPVGWAMAGNTPFRFWKHTNHEGGVRDPLIVSWPRRIPHAGLRAQFHHVSDLMPTILEALGIDPPAEVDGVVQQPVDGISMVYSFADADARDRKQTQYFEMFGNRALWAGGWKAVLLQDARTWQFMKLFAEPVRREGWELYDLRADPNERIDLASREAAKLSELTAIFEEQARRYGVYPLRPSPLELNQRRVAALLARDAGRFVYTRNSGQRIAEANAPPFARRAHSITAHIQLTQGRAHGALAALGGNLGGFALFLDDGRPSYVYNYFGQERFRIASRERLAPGPHELRFEFSPGDGLRGEGVIQVDGKQVARGPIAKLQPGGFSVVETFDVGTDWMEPVAEEYADAPEFSGTLESLVVEIATP